MIVNSLLHFFLNVLGAKRQEDRNDWGRGAGEKRPVGLNDKGQNIFGATRLGVVWFWGEKT